MTNETFDDTKPAEASRSEKFAFGMMLTIISIVALAFLRVVIQIIMTYPVLTGKWAAVITAFVVVSYVLGHVFFDRVMIQ